MRRRRRREQEDRRGQQREQADEGPREQRRSGPPRPPAPRPPPRPRPAPSPPPGPRRSGSGGIGGGNGSSCRCHSAKRARALSLSLSLPLPLLDVARCWPGEGCSLVFFRRGRPSSFRRRRQAARRDESVTTMVTCQKTGYGESDPLSSPISDAVLLFSSLRRTAAERSTAQVLPHTWCHCSAAQRGRREAAAEQELSKPTSGPVPPPPLAVRAPLAIFGGELAARARERERARLLLVRRGASPLSAAARPAPRRRCGASFSPFGRSNRFDRRGAGRLDRPAGPPPATLLLLPRTEIPFRRPARWRRRGDSGETGLPRAGRRPRRTKRFVPLPLLSPLMYQCGMISRLAKPQP
jgi:hypothetical protein